MWTANKLSERVTRVDDLCELINEIINNNYKLSNEDEKNNIFYNKILHQNLNTLRKL